MNQNDLYIEYARVIEMCRGTALENKPWLGVKCNGKGFDVHPGFDAKPELYEFPIAILEDRPVFVGDTLYHKDTHKEYKVGDDGVALHSNVDGISKFSFGTYLTWQPPKPKRRIVLEETEKDSKDIAVGEYGAADGSFYRCSDPERWHSGYKVWRIVEDTGNQP